MAGRRLATVEKTPPIPASKIERIAGLIMAGATEAGAATAAGVSPDLLSRYKRAAPRIAQTIEEAKEAADSTVQSRLFRHTEKNVVACIFWLKNRQGWADRKEITGSLDVNILPRLVRESLRPETREKRLELEAGG